MLTAFQEKGYERRDGLCLCEKQSQFRRRDRFDAGPAMVALRFHTTIVKRSLAMPPVKR